MNFLICAFIGAGLSTAVLVGGVHQAQGDQSKVSETQLTQYSATK